MISGICLLSGQAVKYFYKVPPRSKPHKIKTRKSEPFRVNHVSTEQYRNAKNAELGLGGIC